METEKPIIKKLPVTVLSGFLGSGKTTLLKHILENKDNLRCALIVNDMAEINVDSALIKDSQLVKAEEKMISMQNGCICCTLREDLLVNVVELAKQNQFDYLIIESTGISEPIQVAETFAFDIPQEELEQGDDKEEKQEAMAYLKDYSNLDTCVTVVDASNFFSFFKTEESLPEKFPQETTDKQDERTVTELMIDQIEFCNVVIINKIDLVNEKELTMVRDMVRKLNKDAKIIETNFSKVDLKEIINTGLFDMEKAQENQDWLAQDRYNFVPETIEYGISSFIYRQKRPFDNLKIHDLLCDNFYFDLDPTSILDQQQQQMEEEEALRKEQEGIQNPENEDDEWEDEEEEEEEEEEEMDEETIEAALKEYKKDRLEGLRQKNAGVFKNVWRSKGFFWIQGNKKEFYGWSQAGFITKVSVAGVFGCELSEEEISQVPEYKEISSKFDPIVGDRETSIVFIGQNLDQKKISDALDKCLVNDKEFDALVKKHNMQKPYKEGIDPFSEDYDYDNDDEEIQKQRKLEQQIQQKKIQKQERAAKKRNGRNKKGHKHPHPKK